MRIRIIGVDTCNRCKSLVKNYRNLGIDFEYWDGEKDELQSELDKMKINDFPVIQILDDNKVLWATDPILQPSGVSYKKLKIIMERLENGRKK